MSSRLIIIRGNSVSGKSTVARMVRERLEKDYLSVESEQVIPESYSSNQAVTYVLEEISK